MAIGRPKKYTKKKLEEAVEAYFNSISRGTFVLEGSGAIATNDAGEAMKKTEYLRPPTVAGLCLHLGIDRSTWANYCSEELHPELQEVTSRARLRMEAYLEEELLTRTKGLQGIVFNLQNNYGWRQKSEVELGQEARKTAEKSLSIQEKLALIGEVQAQMEADMAAEDGEDR